MHDSMHFTPGDLRVKQGETVRFVATNDGKVMHEMVIGTMKELKEHAALMKKFPDMEHDEPYLAHVKPGGKVTIVWQFTKPGEFCCMRATITLAAMDTPGCGSNGYAGPSWRWRR